VLNPLWSLVSLSAHMPAVISRSGPGRSMREQIMRPYPGRSSSSVYVRSPHGRGIAHASRIRVLKRVCGRRRCVSGRKSSVGPCLMPTCPLDIASIFDVYASEKDPSQTLVLAAAGAEESTVRVRGRYGGGCLEMASRGQACTQPSSTGRS
jgi:hypothetical protein